MDKTSSNTVIDAIQDISKNKQLDHYDNELCKEIKEKMDQRLNERVLKIMEKVDFVSVTHHQIYYIIVNAGLDCCVVDILHIYYEQPCMSVNLPAEQ